MPFLPIPVIDLMGGRVVHARRGDRAHYAPIESGLCHGSDPLDLASALLGLFPFKALYIADLDAIQGRGDHASALARIAHAFPDVEIWLDAGIADAAAYARWCGRFGGRLVVGSETLVRASEIESIAKIRPGCILSLDFRTEPCGDPLLFADAALWPDDLIVMTLTRVGSDNGPDLERGAEIIARASGRRVFAAGGVRGPGDLSTLRSSGYAGVLLASALHNGTIDATALRVVSPEAPA